MQLLRTYTAYLHGVQMRTVSRYPVLRVPPFLLSVRTLVVRGQSRGSDFEGSVKFLCPRELLVIIGQSQGSDIEGSVNFFVQASCS